MPPSLRPPPQPRRTVRFPRSRPLVEPISSADAGFFRSAGFYFRVSMLGLVTLSLFGVLGLRLWSLQLVQGEQLAAEAQQEAFRLVPLPAPRAAIEDREGRLLAGTQARIAITADADTLGALGPDGRWEPNEQGLAVLTRFGKVTRTPPATFVARIQREQLRSPHAPAVVVPRATRALAFYLDERAALFPGLHATPFPTRSYPEGRLGNEFLGLLGEISEDQLKDERYEGRRAGEVIGQSGVEARYDRFLNFGLAQARVAVDARGQAIGPLAVVQQPRPKHSLRLTIDVRIQRAAERAIKQGIALGRQRKGKDARAGAAVVMDAQTGALYALASYPGYSQVRAARDPDYLVGLIRGDDPARPLFNRVVQGTYPLGSTYKPIVAQAALASGLISPWSRLHCSSALTVGDTVFRNVAPRDAVLDLRQALEESCDTWFYRLGVAFHERGSLAMQQWSWRLGIGRPTGLDLPGEATGIVPTPKWLKATHRHEWYPGESVNLSIGQGYLAASPLQLAVAYAALANGGKVVKPHVAEGLYDTNGTLKRRFHFTPRRVPMPHAGAIRAGIVGASTGPRGTSTGIFGDFPVRVAGKTGTAEAPPRSDHSWFASWAPADNPKIVVVVLIENGGFGGEAAAPAAKTIYEAFFRDRLRRPRP
jgi:penicillin-binding protein 2